MSSLSVHMNNTILCECTIASPSLFNHKRVDKECGLEKWLYLTPVMGIVAT